jgi:hypothetical protein
MLSGLAKIRGTGLGGNGRRGWFAWFGWFARRGLDCCLLRLRYTRGLGVHATFVERREPGAVSLEQVRFGRRPVVVGW